MILRLGRPAVRKVRAAGIGGPLAVVGTLAMGGMAHAATVTISTATTTPLATSTVDSGSPGDIDIAGGGSLTLSSGTALTLDSDNNITNSGSVSISDSDNSIGIDISSSATGTVENAGQIVLGNAITDVTHPNYANNKRGILLDSGTTLTGNIQIDAAGALVIRGDDSAAIDLEGALSGNLTNAGQIGLTGDNSVGVHVGSAMTGTITNGGVIATQGINTAGLEITAPVSGLVENDGTIESTGYDHLTPSTSTGPDNYNATQAAQQGREAVGIGASLQGGFLNSLPLSGTPAVINSAGSADALLISPSVSGGSAGNITISDVGTGIDAFGIINGGTILANGIYDGVSSEAVRIEGSSTLTTTIQDGVVNSGTITAGASQASATAFAIGSNATVPLINNTGSISAGSTSSATSSAVGLSIEAGADVPALTNTGTISASFTGPTGSATAIRDLSNSLVTIQNTGVIAVQVVPASGETQATGSAVALDLSATSNDITITNDLPAGYDPSSGITAGTISGATELGSGNDTFNMVNGTVSGAIDFGAGNNTLNVSGGSIVGPLSFGAGADAVNVSGGSYFGAVSDSGGQLTLDITGGSFIVGSASTLNITSAHVASGGTLGVSVDQTGADTTHLVASGAVTFDPGSIVTAHFLGSLPKQVDSSIVTASTLNIGGDPNALLQLKLPFVYSGSLSTATSGSNTSLVLHLMRKTAGDLGIRPNLASELEPLLNALQQDPAVANAVLGTTTNTEFDNAYRQFLPSYTDAVLQAARQATLGYDNSVSSRIEKVFVDQVGAGAWTDERGYTLQRDATSSARGYRSQGFLLSLGLDDYLTDNVLLGVVLGYDGASYKEASDSDTPVSTRHWTGGVYTGGHLGKLLFSGSALLSYGSSSVTRNLAVGGISRTATGDWNGWRYSADADFEYAASFSRFYVRPNAGITYLHMNNGAYTEKGGADPTGGGNTFALDHAARSADSLDAHAEIAIGTNLVQQFSEVGYGPVMKYTITPEFRLGWNYDLINTPIQSRVRFVGSTDWFTVESDTRQRQLLSAGLGFHVNTSYGSFGAGLQAMYGNHMATYAIGLHAGFVF